MKIICLGDKASGLVDLFFSSLSGYLCMSRSSVVSNITGVSPLGWEELSGTGWMFSTVNNDAKILFGIYTMYLSFWDSTSLSFFRVPIRLFVFFFLVLIHVKTLFDLELASSALILSNERFASSEVLMVLFACLMKVVFLYQAGISLLYIYCNLDLDSNP